LFLHGALFLLASSFRGTVQGYLGLSVRPSDDLCRHQATELIEIVSIKLVVEGEHRMALNVELLEQSFELVKPQADNFVEDFYVNLFTDYPASKPLFEHSDMAKQRQMLKSALVMVIENLRKPEALSTALKGLGARHVKYGALPEHYPLVGNSLLKTLGQYAGNAWTPDLKQAWTDAYGAIAELMLEGADYSQAEIALDNVPPSPDAAEAGGLNVELLEQSFALVAPQADELVSSFYQNLFTDYPAAQPLFAHSDMAKQKQMLKSALVMVIENLRKPEALSAALKGLGARHVKYGALPEHYPLVGNSLLKTLEQYVGSAWTNEVKEAWIGAYGAITELMLDGANYDRQDVQLDNGSVTTTETPESNLNTGAAGGLIVGGAAALLVMLLIFL
jgi:nitric oxide dioxygenase